MSLDIGSSETVSTSANSTDEYQDSVNNSGIYENTGTVETSSDLFVRVGGSVSASSGITDAVGVQRFQGALEIDGFFENRVLTEVQSDLFVVNAGRATVETVADPATEIVASGETRTQPTNNGVKSRFSVAGISRRFGGLSVNEQNQPTVSTSPFNASIELVGTFEGVEVPSVSVPAPAELRTFLAQNVSVATESSEGQLANNLWVFNQKALPGLVEEIREYDRLELTFEASADEIEKYRTLAKDDGKYGLVVRSDGGFDSVGTANGNNTFSASAPLQREDLRTVDTYVVEDFSENRVGSQSNVYEIEVTLIPEKEKSWDNEYGTLSSRINDTRQSGEWLFEFERGDIATNRVTTEIERGSGGSTDQVTVTLITRLDGSRIIEESVSRLNAIDSFDVQDGEGGIEDVSDSNRNSVQITSPNDVEFDDGQWIVVGWETEWQNRAFANTLSLEK